MALLGTTARAACGVAFHRDGITAGLVKLLARRFPVTRRLAGAVSFDAALRAFIAAKPAGSPLAPDYGDAFPRFLRRLGANACIRYVSDIAELEAARSKARRAAGAAALPTDAIAAISSNQLIGYRLSFHPSVVLVQSRFPIVSVWRATRNGFDGALREWRAEAALVARPASDVRIWRLPQGGYEFLTELSRGSTILKSAESAANDAPGFDLAANLSLLFKANVVIARWQARPDANRCVMPPSHAAPSSYS